MIHTFSSGRGPNLTSQSSIGNLRNPGPQNHTDLGPKSEWFCGPGFLRLPIEEWEVRFGPSLSGPLPGEKVCIISSNFATNQPSFTGSSINRCSRVSTVIGALARVIAAVRNKSSTGGRKVTVSLLAKAEALLIKDAQKDFKDARKQFTTLMPV